MAIDASLTFGQLLRRFRRAAGLTQEVLAEQAGISVRTISDLERGLYQRPHRDTVQLLADALGLTAEDRRILESPGGRGPAQTSLSTLELVEEAASAQEQAVTAQARVLTFLIADIRGYTHFTQERGDAAAARLTLRFAEVVDAAVTPWEGRVVETRGDEVLVTFASARAALEAAVTLQANLAALRDADPSVPLAAGIGLDAGEAVPVEGGYRGRGLNLAARLCPLAAVGEVLASSAVIHLTGKVEGLAYRDRGLVQIKGFADPVTVLEVVADHDPMADVSFIRIQKSEAQAQPQMFPLGSFLGSLPTNRLVGRDQELGALLDAMDAVLDGTGRLVLLAGESGAGKPGWPRSSPSTCGTAGSWLPLGAAMSRSRRFPITPSSMFCPRCMRRHHPPSSGRCLTSGPLCGCSCLRPSDRLWRQEGAAPPRHNDSCER